MRNQIAYACLAATLLFAACIKDDIKSSYTYYRPVYKTKESVRQNVKSSAPVAVVAPGKLFYKDGYVFLNEVLKGVHVIDIKNPASPVVVSFIAIPGCIDLAVRGNILYADLTTDLVAIDITDPTNVQVTKIVEGVFPHRYYGNYFQNDTSQVIVDWVKVDTTVWSSEPLSWGLKSTDMVFFSSSSTAAATNGIGGSMARFALYADRLYTVSHGDLKVFNTARPDQPAYVKQVPMYSSDIETIFPYGDHLFIGSQTGMHIYSVQNKDNPVKQSMFTHARVCDPVVANSKYAYVTLRNGTRCGGFTNQLDVINIENLNAPSLLKSYSLSNPHGLSIVGNTLLICDGADGLKIFDASVPTDVKQIGRLSGFTAVDVIAINNLAIVSAEKGLHLVDFTDPAQPKMLSAITIGK
ncbi:MAG TPA: hypothetical protein VLC98_13625 [Phnomibacter sp.]|nr:hypothetical protein [Phnomibacter sp.]